MIRSLQDMVVVITGASSGIGKALAIELAGQGAHLVLGARRLDRLEQINADLGGKHLCLSVDVSRPEDCKRLISAATERFGRLDTLVCNAGYGFAKPFDTMCGDDIRRIFETNVFGTTECCRLAVPIMKKQPPRDGLRGQLMIVSSACARRGLPFFSTYAATKAAQLSLAEGLRVELKPDGIAVTSVHPVVAETDFFDTAADLGGMNPAALAQGKKQAPAAVARKMVRAIQKPCRELWPKRLFRLGLNMAVLLPAMADADLSRRRDEMLRGNGHGH